MLVFFLRHGFPAIVCLSGIALFAYHRDINAADGASMLLGAGLSWWLMGWLFRKGVEGESERDVEDAARHFLDEHGRWPTDSEYATFEREGRWTPAGDRPASTAPSV